jgi:hypothetical protein
LLEKDFQDACDQLRAGLTTVSRRRGWHVADTTAVVSAASFDDQVLVRDPITELLRSSTYQRRELAPWIP